jgi:alkylated DNA repair dioxygenase AlkB
MRGIVELPAGLRYEPAFLDVDEADRLTELVAGLEFEPVVMHGQEARRRVRHFGFGYGYDSWRLTEAAPLPPWLLPLRAKCAMLAGIDATAFAEALVTSYPPGATIGWHRDAPAFGAVVVGVSLLSPCAMRFQRQAPDGRRVYEVALEPGSAYVLAGAARSTWQHSIPAVTAQRYSVTFRTLRSGASAEAGRGRASAEAGRGGESAGQRREPVGERDGREVAEPARDDLDADG